MFCRAMIRHASLARSTPIVVPPSRATDSRSQHLRNVGDQLMKETHHLRSRSSSASRPTAEAIHRCPSVSAAPRRCRPQLAASASRLNIVANQLSLAVPLVVIPRRLQRHVRPSPRGDPEVCRPAPGVRMRSQYADDNRHRGGPDPRKGCLARPGGMPLARSTAARR